jgi:hypothetical protein
MCSLVEDKLLGREPDRRLDRDPPYLLELRGRTGGGIVVTVGDTELEDCGGSSWTGAEECDTRNLRDPLESACS